MATLDGALKSVFDSLDRSVNRLEETDDRRLFVAQLQLAIGQLRKDILLGGTGAIDVPGLIADLLDLAADISDADPSTPRPDAVDAVLERTRRTIAEASADRRRGAEPVRT